MSLNINIWLTKNLYHIWQYDSNKPLVCLKIFVKLLINRIILTYFIPYKDVGYDLGIDQSYFEIMSTYL